MAVLENMAVGVYQALRVSALANYSMIGVYGIQESMYGQQGGRIYPIRRPCAPLRASHQRRQWSSCRPTFFVYDLGISTIIILHACFCRCTHTQGTTAQDLLTADNDTFCCYYPTRYKHRIHPLDVFRA